MRFLKIISIVVAIIGVMGTLVWLVAANLVPSGVFEEHWRPDSPSALIGPIVPESRLLPLGIADDGTLYRSLVEEPVNFDVRLPSNFDTATVSVTVAGDPKIVELGGLVSRETWTNDLRPGSNSIIDNLDWTAVRGNGLTLYERRPDFKTVDDFLADLPVAGVATYHADVSALVKIPGYVPAKTITTYRTPFRGATSIKVYLQNEPLDFTFLVQDLNRHIGADGFTAVATLAGEPVARAQLADDSDNMGDGKLSTPRDLHLYTNKPLTGIVRIDLPASDDVVFREILTKQKKFVFSDRFYAADNVGYLKDPAAFSIVTNGRRLYATTTHPQGFQTLAVGSQKLTIDDLNKPFTISTADDVRRSGLVPIVSTYGDLRLETAGLFAFTKDNFFNPDPLPLTWETDVDKDGINYILTSYVPPSRNGEWRTMTATFDLAKLSVESRAANFTISVPGIDIQQKELRISAIDVTLRRAPLAGKDIWPAIVKMWRLMIGADKEYPNSLTD
jgi:hypothetical protein